MNFDFSGSWNTHSVVKRDKHTVVILYCMISSRVMVGVYPLVKRSKTCFVAAWSTNVLSSFLLFPVVTVFVANVLLFLLMIGSCSDRVPEESRSKNASVMAFPLSWAVCRLFTTSSVAGCPVQSERRFGYLDPMGPCPIPPEQVSHYELPASLSSSSIGSILGDGKEASSSVWLVAIAPLSTTQQVCLVC